MEENKGVNVSLKVRAEVQAAECNMSYFLHVVNNVLDFSLLSLS